MPFIRTYLFEQEAEGENDEKLWLFREPITEEEQQQSDAPEVTAIREDQLYQVLDLDGLIKSLGELVHLHPLQPSPKVAPAPSNLARTFRNWMESRKKSSRLKAGAA